MQLQGSITALVTPFSVDGSIDFPAFARLIAYQLAGGTQGVVVAGSTGEAAALTLAEYQALIRFAVEQVGGRIPVLAGTGQSATRATIEQTRRAKEAGAEFALVVTPPYVRPTGPGLLAHYRAVVEEGGLPVVLYNVPGRTGCDMTPEVVAELAGLSGIVGIKEAKADPLRIEQLLRVASDDFVVLSGDDPTAFEAFGQGAHGVISVASNAAPASMRKLWEVGRNRESLGPDAGLQALFDFLAVESNPIPIKALLAAVGLINDGLRLPLLPLSSGPRARLEEMRAWVASVEPALSSLGKV
ncbi:4-hydroxy-tetrahydrodipicolinate synthase [Pseudomarimonas arenosa]|uniref:4-hydroxy-tetrahydrodipicolinate synthase n=1 Tax=Pseudomarimonas arenosa TaxID=2774145 RepID=A0AAW3ZNM4_9GAMM|nr:4-hydroxy-tetrahydrodipicolinate synthase [Pseudomarimonas arenosa]